MHTPVFVAQRCVFEEEPGVDLTGLSWNSPCSPESARSLCQPVLPLRRGTALRPALRPHSPPRTLGPSAEVLWRDQAAVKTKERLAVIISLLAFLGKLALKARKSNVKYSKRKRQTNNEIMSFS